MSFLLITLASCLAFAVDPSSHPTRIGQALVHLGDAPDLEAVSYDDSNWRRVPIPCLGDACGLNSPDGIVWYRASFEVTNTQRQLAIYPGRLWGAEEVFVNGFLVGGRGHLASRYAEVWGADRIYSIPRSALRRGKNLVAFRMLNTDTVPGLAADPLWLGPESQLREQRESNTTPRLLWRGVVLTMAVGAVLLALLGFFAGLKNRWVLLAVAIGISMGWFLNLPGRTRTVEATIIENAIFYGVSLPATALFPTLLLPKTPRWILFPSTALGGVGLALFSIRPTLEVRLTWGPWFSGIFGLLALAASVLLVLHLLRHDRQLLWTATLWLLSLVLIAVSDFFPVLIRYDVYDWSQSICVVSLGGTIGVLAWRHRKAAIVARARMLSIADDERRRIAATLHDGLGQDLQSTRMSLQLWLRDQKEEGSASSTVRLAVDALSTMLDQVRALARSTHPNYGAKLRLDERLEQFVEQMDELAPASFTLSWEGPRTELDEQLSHDAFRIVQEAASNALRHNSNVEQVRVSVTLLEDKLKLEVVGGAPFIPKPNEGVGWTSMLDRAAQHGGALCVDAFEGQAVVRFEAPIPAQQQGK